MNVVKELHIFFVKVDLDKEVDVLDAVVASFFFSLCFSV